MLPTFAPAKVMSNPGNAKIGAKRMIAVNLTNIVQVMETNWENATAKESSTVEGRTPQNQKEDIKQAMICILD